MRSPYLVFAKRLEPLSDAGRRRKEEIALVEDNYHKDRIANRRLHPETLMMGYGYAPGLSEGSLKPPIFLTSTFVFENAQQGKDFFDLTWVCVTFRARLIGMEASVLARARYSRGHTWRA